MVQETNVIKLVNNHKYQCVCDVEVVGQQLRETDEQKH